MLPLDVAATGTADTGADPGGTPSGAPDPVHDRPIGFALTTRARRAVAPASLPPLSVVADRSGARDDQRGEGGALEEPGDTRPARARALRRAGVPVVEIARQLRTDTLTVAAWVGEVAPRGHLGPRAQPTDVDPTTVTQHPDPSSVGPAERPAATEEDLVAHHLARAAAGEAARQRLGEDPGFALGVGILASLAEIDQHAITLSGGAPELVARALDVLAGEHPAVRERARVIVRVGRDVAGDLVRHRTATALGLEPVQVTWTRWRGAGRSDAVQLLARIADPELAATVGGWVDAALEPAPEPATAWHA